MKKSIIIWIIIILVVLAWLYYKNNFLDKNQKISNIESLEHSWAGDIE